MDDLVITNIVRFVDQRTLIITCYSINPQFQRCAQLFILINDGNFRLACQQGDRSLIQWMIQQGVTNFSFGLEGACEGGHLEIAEWMIQKGAKNWNFGLYAACLRGQLELVEWMINLGTINRNFGLSGACEGNHPEIAKWMIDLGATHCYHCDDRHR